MEKKIISAKIPIDMYNKIIQSEYNTNTDCIIAALNLLFDNTQQEPQFNDNGNTELIPILKEHIEYLKDQVLIKDGQIADFQGSQKALITKLESKPLQIVEYSNHENNNKKTWWQFWK